MKNIALFLLVAVLATAGYVQAAISHEVKPGETLAQIAEFYYGDPAYAQLLGEANTVSDPQTGMWLKVPTLTEIVRARAEKPQTLAQAATVVPPQPSPEAKTVKTYTVKNGDTLSGIARTNRATVSEIVRLNGLKEPAEIRVGQKLRLPDEDTAFPWKRAGGLPFSGTLDQGLTLLGYPEKVKELFRHQVEDTVNVVEEYEIRPGDRFAMVFGEDILRRNTVAAWDQGVIQKADRYSVEIDGVQYFLVMPHVCGNWARTADEKIVAVPKPQEPAKTPETPAKPPIAEPTAPPPVKATPLVTPMTPETVELRPRAILVPDVPSGVIPTPVRPSEPIREVPAVEAPKAPTPTAAPPAAMLEPRAIFAPPDKPVIEHEPIIGAYDWWNQLAEGRGGYAEYTAWLRNLGSSGYRNGLSLGAGVYVGPYGDGESKTSTYTWSEKGIGPQIGLKYLGENHVAKPWYFQLKARYVFETTEGRNDEGYRMEQHNEKLGLYAELTNRPSWNTAYGLTAEYWHALKSSIDSTYAGDRPQNRDQIMIDGFLQKRLSDRWQLRFSGGWFHQGWDELDGVRGRLEFRYNEWVMFGPWVSAFPFGLSDCYATGTKASDLTTYGLGIRFEFGPLLRPKSSGVLYKNGEMVGTTNH